MSIKNDVRQILTMVLLITASNAWAINPTSLQLRIYEMRVSENTDCSNARSVFEDANAGYVDFAANGTLGSGAIPNKTYRCVMFHVSDDMIVVPDTTASQCAQGNTYHQDIFNTPGVDESIDPDGNAISGSAIADEKPWIYFSDSDDAAAINGCYQPTLTGNGGPCVLDALAISGEETRSLVFDLDGKIGDANASCGATSAPTLSIR